MEKWRNLSKKKKILCGIALCFILSAGTVLGIQELTYAQEKSNALDQIQLTIADQTLLLEHLQNDTLDLFVDEDRNFLKASVDEEQIDALKEKVNSLKSRNDEIAPVNITLPNSWDDHKLEISRVKNQLASAASKLEILTEINAFFEEDVLVDDSFVDTIAIREDLTTEKLSKYVIQDRSMRDIVFRNFYGRAITEAQNQLRTIESAQKLVDELFDNDEVKQTPDKTAYKEALSEVEEIKNETIAKPLLERLEKVNKAIAAVEKEKKVAEKQAQEAAATSEAIVDTQTDASVSFTEQATEAAIVQAPAGGSTQSGNNASTGGSTASQGNTNQQSSSNNQNNTQDTTPPSQPTQPSEPSTPSGPPAGWIVPPHPIGSVELANWLADQGYSGYWSSGGYIQPY